MESNYEPGTFECYSVEEVVDSITGSRRAFDMENHQVEVDWYLSYGLCR